MNQKDTIYIDIDDEITSIIDKVRSADNRLVALVLPKRATMLQSSVNMKLLKKAADDDKKRVILITTESGLLPLAADVGIHVAQNLQSKPEIPTAISSSSSRALDELVSIDETGAENNSDFDAKKVANKSVGDLAGYEKKNDHTKAVPTLPIPDRPVTDDDSESIELDNDDEVPEIPLDETPGKGKKSKQKAPKVPNFNKFRLRLILGFILLVLLVGGWIAANIILPKATIAITTKTSSVNTTLDLTLTSSVQSLDTSKLLVPAHIQQTQKTSSQQVATTGQKNEGSAATGTVTMTATECNITTPADVPAGTGISTNGQTYITQQDVTFNYQTIQNGCLVFQGNGPVSITAQSPGTQSNVSNATFTVAGRSDVTATGSASGGTDNIVQVVTQADIDKAKQQIASQDTTSIKTSLANDLTSAGYYPVQATFNASSPKITSSNNVGDQASTVTVTETITYTMFGVHKSDIATLIKNNVDQQISSTSQTIQNDGINQSAFNVTGQSGNSAQVTLEDTAIVGPHFNVAAIKKQIAGKKSGQVNNIINANPGVTAVKIKYSPFWVGSVPNNVNKITIKFLKS